MTEHPNEADMANKRERDIAYWREQAADAVDALKPFIVQYEPWMDRYDEAELMPIYAKHTFGDVRRARRVIGASVVRDAEINGEPA